MFNSCVGFYIMSTFKKQYESPKWQKKRLEVLELSNYTCEECGDKETQLHVHHVRYIKGRKVWEYHTDALQCLCKNCHQKRHDTKEHKVVEYFRDAFNNEGFCKTKISAYSLYDILNDKELRNDIFEFLHIISCDETRYLLTHFNQIAHKVFNETSKIKQEIEENHE